MDVPRITPEELDAWMRAEKQVTLVDVRNPQAWGESDVRLPGAIRVPHGQLEQNLAKIPKNRPVVAYCT